MPPSEKENLQKTQHMIREAIAHATRLSERTEETYSDIKTYMVSNRGEIDPSEQFQNELFLADVDRQSSEAHSAKVRLEKLLDSPYFARVDFAEDDRETTVGLHRPLCV